MSPSRRNSRTERCPTVKWSGIQNSLEESRSDVLILLDCCASGVCTTDEGNGVTELIAACAYNAITNGVGPFSFTHALIAKLRLLAQLQHFTIGYLYNALFTEIQGWRIEEACHKKAPVYLILSQNSDLPRSIRLSSHSKMMQKSGGCASTTDLSNIIPPTCQDTTQISNSLAGNISSSEESDAKDISPLSLDTSPPSSMKSMSQLPEYPRLLFSIRIDEDVKPGELSAELFTDWLREIPVVASLVRVEAGFASDSTLLMVSMPATMLAYLSANPAITLLGTMRSRNLLTLPTKGLQAATESSACNDTNTQSKEETPRSFGSTIPRDSSTSLQNQRVATTIQGSGHSVSPTRVNSWTPLSYPIEKGHEAMVDLFLKNSADIDSKDRYIQTPLSWVTEKGHEAVIKLLLEKCAYIDSESDSGRTLLSWAAENGQEAVVKLLLEKGANVDSRSDSRRTALSLAAEKGHEAVVKLLLENGANVDSRSGSRRMPLSWAAENGHEAVVKLLLEKGANVDSRSDSGRTALSWAAENGHEAVVKLLLEKGAYIDSKSLSRRTALSLAAEKGHEAVVNLLLEKGAHIDSESDSRRTPLSWAAEKGHEAVVKLLLEKGANVDSESDSGRTPLSWAVKSWHWEVVELLLEKGARRGLMVR
jgi:ankyrin repeat protein